MTNSSTIKIVNCISSQEIKKSLYEVLSTWQKKIPSDKGARILLKPNLNSNMNALTGNTTDLRVIAAVISFLKEHGYENITIGEGTNSGFYRNNISVIARLGVDRLANYFGVNCIDLNMSESVDIDFEDGIKAGVAREVMEAEFLINLPKLKTHFEAGMSACLKNLIGCLVGQENKKKTHKSLAANILHLQEQIRPQIHIVDALFAMEGLGPTKGTPVKTDMLIVGDDPYVIDLFAARYASFDYTKVVSLAEAERIGLITSKHHAIANKIDVKPYKTSFAPPVAGHIATFIHNPKRQKYFLAIRNTSLFNFLCNTKLAGKLLCWTGLRQDVFIDEEMDFQGLQHVEEKCNDCGKCSHYCPLELQLPDVLKTKEMDKCISCLYCFCVCPQDAIEFNGTLGFMDEQMRQYDEIIRRIA